MSLFRCTKCKCIENTACSNFWVAVYFKKKLPLCSECDPEIGLWHNLFEKKSAVGLEVDNVGILVNQWEHLEEQNKGR